MKLNYRQQTFLEDIRGEKINISGFPTTPHGVLSSQMGLKKLYLDGKRIYISRETLDAHYEPVENFSAIEFSKVENKLISYFWIYKDKEEDYYIGVDVNLQEKYDEDGTEIYEEGLFKVIELYYRADDSKSTNLATSLLNSRVISNIGSDSKISIVLKTASGFKFKEQRIKPLTIDITSMYNDDFEPVHNHIISSLKKQSKGIILLHGKAGTGKTNYIKYLTTLVPEKRFVFIPVSVIPHLTDPSFIGELIDNKGTILVLEDCENYLKDRGSGENSVVSTILNLSDGILSDVLGIQIICTFNANLSKVDEALLRKGRLIDEYEFGVLSDDKIQKLLTDLNIPDTEASGLTLSEVFNLNDQSSRTQSKQKKIGF